VFSRAEQDILIDSIPLCEIKSIEQLKETLNDTNGQANEDDSAKTQFQSLLTRKKSMIFRTVDVESYTQESNLETTIESDPKVSITNISARAQATGGGFEMSTRMPQSNVIQIKTDREGHNSGRTYYFRTKTPDEDGQLVTTLSRLAKSAKIKAENKSRFQRNQLHVRTVYNSQPFQYLIAALIFGVR
jgi:hypothetical protein